MVLSRAQQPRTHRFQLRATASEEELIRVAAERQGMNITDFIMRSAREKAEEALSEQTRFIIDEARWKKFIAVLDRPAQDKPRLRRLFKEEHVARRGS